MLILGVFLFVFHVYYWFNDPNNSSFVKKIKETPTEELQQLESEELFKLLSKAIVWLITVFSALIGYIIFLAVALGIDILLYPTVIMIAWLIFGLVVSTKKLKKNKVAVIKKTNAFVRSIKYIITLTYIAYILYLLVA